jgi:hypothetical protein
MSDIRYTCDRDGEKTEAASGDVPGAIGGTSAASCGTRRSRTGAQVPELSVIERCRCGDDFCGMFYVLPKPAGAYGPGHRNVALTPKEGMLILDVVSDKIAAVEVLYRNEIRQKLQIEFP